MITDAFPAAVKQSTHEIGIRMGLGAIGAAVGTVTALSVSRLL